MAAAGVSDFVEFGAKVLTPMVKRTVDDVATHAVVSMDEIEALLKAI